MASLYQGMQDILTILLMILINEHIVLQDYVPSNPLQLGELNT